MCDVESNPKWTLQHIDELLDNVETNSDKDEMRRMLCHDYRLKPDEEEPEYVDKRNRVFEALVDFINLLKKEKSRNHHVIVTSVKV